MLHKTLHVRRRLKRTQLPFHPTPPPKQTYHISPSHNQSLLCNTGLFTAVGQWLRGPIGNKHALIELTPAHLPLPPPRFILIQTCHSARGQRPPFCLARGLKNQSHVQEIHPTRLSDTEWTIVCSGSGRAAHFWSAGNANAGVAAVPSVARMHSQTHAGCSSCGDLAQGFALDIKNSRLFSRMLEAPAAAQ